jgi:hypothetical protein
MLLVYKRSPVAFLIIAVRQANFFKTPYHRCASIFCCASFNCASVTLILGWLKLRSLEELMGMRCMWACGTSRPMTDSPQRLHGKARSMAFAIGFANTRSSDKYASSISKKLSRSTLGTTNTWPSRRGMMSRNAKNLSSSLIL